MKLQISLEGIGKAEMSIKSHRLGEPKPSVNHGMVTNASLIRLLTNAASVASRINFEF